MRNLAIFASGSGTNAENLIRYFSDHPEFRVAVVLCNKPDAFVLERARRLEVPSVVFNRSQLVCEGETTEEGKPSVMAILKQYDAFALILAGFLMRIPPHMIEAWPRRIINIHPALLPKYGGKGMHGMHVHEAVVAAKEMESGITIHLVDEEYDHGKALFQAKCEVLPCDTAHDVAAKIHLLEQEYFPTVVDDYLSANYS
ncbi:MAG: phosphoribosylglycinamide formyltransferase [Bacteroidales bacterium]|nr:phosphoribosylglycinamide formyltransferase [Bacteroidales bacterium]MBO7479407.1 phosphoribosylglycinamide formyltransferase [Bacteroidales bacterium]MBO7487357.1 phosphoribosylglycinamide formyltransferase [Bacteroidales bacterium]